MHLPQLVADSGPVLCTTLEPRTWPAILELLSLQKKPWTLCVDELPYLTATAPSLPSQLQRWLDHSIPKGCLLILAGSSTAMMNDLFLHRSAPLYGRAQKLLHVQPMDYAAFCKACKLKPRDAESFEMYSLVGGIPKYWEFVEDSQDAIGLAEALYFDFAPYMEQEPQRILRDEGVHGANPLAVLEAIGRGAERPSEISQRLGTAQTNLSRVFQQLLDASVLARELPYGENIRSTKKTLYRIQDPTLRFWFRVYSPHRSRWMRYDAKEKRQLIHAHASTVFEDACRARYPDSGRYWEKDIEIDLIAPDPAAAKGLVIAEVKWSKLTIAAKRRLMEDLEARWKRTTLSRKHRGPVRFEILDASADWA